MKRRYAFEIAPSTGLHELADFSGDPLAKRFVAVYCRAVYSDGKLTDEEYRFLESLLKDC